MTVSFKRLIMVLMAFTAMVALSACQDEVEQSPWDAHVISQSDDTLFFVYAYTETCPACISIKDDIASFKASNAMDIELIAINVHQVDESIEFPEGLAVPRVYIVYNGEITRYETGVTDVLYLFASVETETFTP